jgi:organic hydroperoxide reductase OsmC/OhrA
MTAPFPHRYEVHLEAAERSAWLSSAARPPLEGGAPPEFDGSPGVWSPEHLLLSSLALCHFTTFQALARKARLDVLAFRTKGEAVLSKTPEGLGFTELVLDVTLDVRPEDREKAAALLESAKRHCLVANALRPPVRLEGHVRASSEASAEVSAAR